MNIMENNHTQIIREKFLLKLKSLIPIFKDFESKLNSQNFSDEEFEYTRISVHQIAGSANTFGFPGINDDATKSELYFNNLIENRDNNDDIRNLAQSLNKLVKVSEELIKNGSEICPSNNDTEPMAPKTYKYNIIICDDDSLVIEYVKNALAKHNCYVIGIEDGREVTNQAKQRMPNLIIQDVNMPKSNGFDILNELKSDVRTKNIPVMMLTKKAELSNVQKGIESGADDYIAKPFDIDTLVKRVLKIIER